MAMVSALDQLDARHLRAVTLAVSGLENARVSAGPLGELGAELLEQFSRRFALVDVPHGVTPVVQRPVARLGDQLLDEGPQLLGLGLRRLDRAVLDERRRETPHQGKLLFARAPERAPRFAMPHCLTPPCRRAPRRRPTTWRSEAMR